MVRNINFIGRQGRYDLPTSLLTDNEPLTLKLNGLDAKLGKYILTLKHGGNIKTIVLGPAMTVDIFADWLNDGQEKILEAFLELRDNLGTRVLIPSVSNNMDTRGFIIEPLKLERIDEQWSIVAWLQSVEQEIEAIKLNQKLTDAATIAHFKAIEDKFAEYEDKGVPLQIE